MKKKILSVLLASAMVCTMAACGDTSSDDGSSDNAGTSSGAGTNTDAGTSDSGSTDSGSTDSGSTDSGSAASGETITVWVADAVVSFTQDKAAEFMAAHPEYAKFAVSVEAVGEGDAASNMITDVVGGADLYGFAQDQLGRLLTSGALMEITNDYAEYVKANNSAGAVAAGSSGDAIYAFPMTADNGYFMYYDSSVISDPTSLEQILADCEAAGKGFYMDIQSGWYDVAFFFGTGCTVAYDYDSEGNVTGFNCDYVSDKGLVAFKEMIEMADSTAFYNGASVADATNAAAVVSGTWDSDPAKTLFGDNYACSKLPQFVGSDGNTYQMYCFNGCKLLGVKPQTDIDKAIAVMELAKYLTSEEVQLARFEAVGWGPSNIAAAASDAVSSNDALAALNQQFEYSIGQGNYPGDYWTNTEALGQSINADEFDNKTDEELMAQLQDLYTKLEAAK